MEFMTAALLSGVVYDALKSGALITTDILKNKLKDWIVDEGVILRIKEEIENLEINDEMSEKAIERKFERSYNIIDICRELKPASSKSSINQYHTGSGDNVGGNKIVN